MQGHSEKNIVLASFFSSSVLVNSPHQSDKSDIFLQWTVDDIIMPSQEHVAADVCINIQPITVFISLWKHRLKHTKFDREKKLKE